MVISRTFKTFSGPFMRSTGMAYLPFSVKGVKALLASLRNAFSFLFLVAKTKVNIL